MSRQTGAGDAGVNPRSRSIQVGEFEVARPGGIWVAIGVFALACRPERHNSPRALQPEPSRPSPQRICIQLGHPSNMLQFGRPVERLNLPTNVASIRFGRK